MADSFPIWPPTSPQHPAAIPGGQVLRQLGDLIYNQIPTGRNDEIPLHSNAIPRINRPELPGSPEMLDKGRYGSTLYDLFIMTQNAVIEREIQYSAKKTGG